MNNHPKSAMDCGKVPYISTRKCIVGILDDLTYEGNTKRYLLAEKLVNMALGGDINAIKVVLERADGKVPDSIDITTASRDDAGIERLREIDPDRITAAIRSVVMSDEDRSGE